MSQELLISEGLVYGLTLTALLGPIFIALTQTGIESGIRAGVLVGLGIWTSDILILLGLFWLIGDVGEDTFGPIFSRTIGTVGGLVLAGVGISSFKRKDQKIFETPAFTAKDIGSFFLKGFLVNTVNPFTFIFWTTLMTTYVIKHNLTKNEALLFFGVIILTIVVTDTAKVIFAKWLRRLVNPSRMHLISKTAGIILLIFGVILIIRSWQH